MNGLVITMWLLGLGVIGGSRPGGVWIARAECELRSLPHLLGPSGAGRAHDCACDQDVKDEDVKDEDVKDEDVKDDDVCDGCDRDEQEQQEAE